MYLGLYQIDLLRKEAEHYHPLENHTDYHILQHRIYPGWSDKSIATQTTTGRPVLHMHLD